MAFCILMYLCTLYLFGYMHILTHARSKIYFVSFQYVEDFNKYSVHSEGCVESYLILLNISLNIWNFVRQTKKLTIANDI